MNAKLALVVVVLLVVGLMANAYAHKAETVGNYKVVVGWKIEPPLVAKKNAIEIIVTTSNSKGVTGLGKTLEADVTLNGKKTFLNLVEDTKKKGTYYGDFTPPAGGFPTVHVVGKINGTPAELTFHPEKVVKK
jgi:fructose-specific component phosphotransferase system IIB-like protein